ncbi:MAG: RNA polymerase sigma-70 factor [Prolixibacteraceae bacterium]|nr:RNA polymerase sigma-70 factor [Prolixibacteraceae bacterium]
MEHELDMMLYNSIKEGNAHAFELLFMKYYTPLCLFAAKYTHDIDVARDVVQNLFVYLWENRLALRIENSVKSYLISAIRRNSIRLVQQQRPVQSKNSHIAEELYDSLELEELNRQLHNAIEQLPSQCKKIFKMSRFDEMKYAEIARKLDLSIKTVEAQMGKALKLLRNKFRHEK